jgi:histidyl-tRNA synthetase
MGVDRIVAAMPGEAVEERLLVFVVVADRERRAAALDLVASLRSRGLAADLDLGERSVKAQFKVASRRGAAVAAVVGDEWADGRVTVRGLATGEEETVTIAEVAAWAQAR